MVPIGPAMEHYRNHVIWVQETKSERSSDNVWFKHKYITNPSLTAADHIVNAAKGLTEALKTNKPSTMSQQSNKALAKLANIFNEAARKYSDKEAARNAQLPGVNSRRPPRQPTRSTTPAPGVQTPSANASGVPRRNAAPPGVHNQPVYRLRNQEIHSVTDEAMLSALEMTEISVKAQNLAARKYPLQLIWN